ncbi:hypothetical protein OEZ85_011371 [Tetradesmus obliquus]|uniref:Uncharacterized protein n=1 Tax=Tetradesmus obliquus TaxID=3088 RepID=A0ABY8TQ53_TETOB|nr:hypothetical protein OEZ85_011371 [Tetradesmus obliquus]
MQQQEQPALQSALTAGFDPAAAAAMRAAATGNLGSSSSSSRPRQSPVASAAAQALSQLQAAQAAQKSGDYAAALAGYSAVVSQHPDLALAEYARLGRALMLYEAGDVSGCLVGLQDQELSMRGYPEVHAALAAVLYTERPAQRLRAEQQFNIAVEFDARFQDAAWVRANKAWGPRLMGALTRFLLLQ